MPVNTFKGMTNFNSGEISPNMYGRIDTEKYQNACEVLENWIILPQGGVKNRSGLQYVSSVADHSSKTRLIPWKGGQGKDYIMEFCGNGTIRLLKNGVPILTVPTEQIDNGTFNTDLQWWTDNSVINWARCRWSSYYGGTASLWINYHPDEYISSTWIASMYQDHKTVVPGQTYNLSWDLSDYIKPKVRVVVPNALAIIDSYISITIIYQGVNYSWVYYDRFNQINTGRTTVQWTAPAIGGGTARIEIKYGLIKIGGGSFRLDSATNVLIDNVSFSQATGSRLTISPSPYNTDALLDDIQFVQKADEMWLAHPSIKPQRIVRFGELDWEIKEAPFLPPPVKEEERVSTVAGALSALSGTATLTLPAGELIGSFGATTANEAVGRGIKYRNGYGIVTAAPTSTTCTVNIIYPFSTLNLPANQWKWIGSPRSGLTITKTGGTGNPTPAPQLGEPATLTLAIAGWRGNEIGKYVRANSGVYKITSITSNLIATGICLKKAVHKATTTGAIVEYMDQIPGGAWLLCTESWYAGNYPSAVQFYEDRLCFGGTQQQPSTLWASATGDYNNFGLGAFDNDALEFGISAQVLSKIRWLASSRVMVGGTVGGEFRISGGGDGPITPTSVQTRNETNFGVATIQPAKVNQYLLAWQRSKRKLLALSFAYESDSYNADDLTLLADHIAESGISSMDFQREFVPMLWCARNDGRMISLTFLPDQKVFGWARHSTDGAVESITTIQSINEDRDIIYAVVRRTIDGQVRRFIEVMDSAVYLDSCVTLTFSGPATYRVAHLPMTTVTVATEDEVIGTYTTDANGDFTLGSVMADQTAFIVGLPYRSTLVTVPPEVPLKSGISQGRVKKWSEVYARVLGTRGLQVNNEQFPTDTLLDGDVRADVVGLDRSAKITLIQDYPFPAKILMIHGSLQIGD